VNERARELELKAEKAFVRKRSGEYRDTALSRVRVRKERPRGERGRERKRERETLEFSPSARTLETALSFSHDDTSRN
jgi:hypothetical protein